MNRQPGAIVSLESIEHKIFLLRGEKVMLSMDLAALYGVEVKVLNQNVKRNISRFPGDFIFQLTKEDFTSLKSQIVTSNRGGIRRALPYAFTEHVRIVFRLDETSVSESSRHVKNES